MTSRQSVKHLLVQEVYLEILELNQNLFLKHLENISANSEIANQYNNGMLNALKNIESSLTSLAKITIRSGAQAAVRNISGMGTTHNSTTGRIFDLGHILFSQLKNL